MMTPRERVLKAMAHEEPDRIPIDLGGMNTTIEAEAYEDLKRYLGMTGLTKVSARAHVIPDEEVLTRFDIDTRYVYSWPPQVWKPDVAGSEYVDEWGVRWAKKASSFYFDIADHPLRDVSTSDLKYYAWPRVMELWPGDEFRKEAQYLYEKTDYAIVANAMDVGLFERAWFLRGFEQFLADLIVNPEFACALLDRVLEVKLEYLSLYLGAVGDYVHVVMLGDDIAMQTGPIFSMELYRRIIKPRHKELHDFVRSCTNAKLFFHCCGSVYPFLEDLLEIGVDIINPVQVTADNMDTRRLKEEFGERLVFWGGGCDTQRVLQFGTPEEVEQEVKKRIYDLAPGGGFIFNQVHCIQPGVPPENICAMYEAIKKYGRYPLSY